MKLNEYHSTNEYINYEWDDFYNFSKAVISHSERIPFHFQSSTNEILCHFDIVFIPMDEKNKWHLEFQIYWKYRQSNQMDSPFQHWKRSMKSQAYNFVLSSGFHHPKNVSKKSENSVKKTTKSNLFEYSIDFISLSGNYTTKCDVCIGNANVTALNFRKLIAERVKRQNEREIK